MLKDCWGVQELAILGGWVWGVFWVVGVGVGVCVCERLVFITWCITFKKKILLSCGLYELA